MSEAHPNGDMPPLVPQEHGGALYGGGVPGNNGGRPDNYEPRFCEVVVEKGREGATLAEMTLACGQARRETLHDWARKYPQFSEALTLARLESLVWWERQGKAGLHDEYKGRKFNDRQWKQMMAGMFPEESYGTDPLATLVGKVDWSSLPNHVLAALQQRSNALATLLAAGALPALPGSAPVLEAEVVEEGEDGGSEGA